MARCCVCKIRLDEPNSDFCHNGHDQIFDYPLDGEHDEEGGHARVSNLDSDDDLAEIPPSSWKPSPKSKRRGMQTPKDKAKQRPRPEASSSSSSPSPSPSANPRAMQVYKVKKERTQNSAKIDWASKIQRSGLTYRLPREKSVERLINVYLCEPIPAKPRDCNCPFIVEMDLDTPLGSKEEINEFIMKLIIVSEAISEHSQLNSGELEIDFRKNATIAQKQTSRVPVKLDFPPYATVRHLVHHFGDDQKSARSIINFMVPVKRRRLANTLLRT